MIKSCIDVMYVYLKVFSRLPGLDPLQQGRTQDFLVV